MVIPVRRAHPGHCHSPASAGVRRIGLSHHRKGFGERHHKCGLEPSMIDTLDAIKTVTEAPSPKTPVPVEPSASAQALVLAAVFGTSAGLARPRGTDWDQQAGDEAFEATAALDSASDAYQRRRGQRPPADPYGVVDGAGRVRGAARCRRLPGCARGADGAFGAGVRLAADPDRHFHKG